MMAPLDMPWQECSVWTEDCPPGFKCGRYTANSLVFERTRCVPLAPDPGQAYEPCTISGDDDHFLDDCDVGLMCWNSVGAEGSCVPTCGGNPGEPICPGEDVCLTLTQGGTVNLCHRPCDPLAVDCPAGTSCVPLGEGYDGFLCLNAGGPVTEVGGECMGNPKCGGGLICVDGAAVPGCASEMCCTAYCDLNAAGDCPDPQQTCVAFEWMAWPPGWDHVGYCSAA